MKKTLLNVAALATLAVAGTAAAQSSVTMYGVADVWVGQTQLYRYEGVDPTTGQFIANQYKENVINSGGEDAYESGDLPGGANKGGIGGLSGSRIGLRIQEDLGGSNLGFVVLEGGLDISNGGGGFARKAVVGLRSPYGTVSLGRQNSAYDDAFARISAQGDSGFDSAKGRPLNASQIFTIAAFNQQFAQGGFGSVSPALLAAAAASTSSVAPSTGAWVGYQKRINNSIRYESPNFNGFSGAFVLGAGENRTALQRAERNGSFHLKYANGPLTLAFAGQADEEQIPTSILSGTFPLAALGAASNKILRQQNTLVGGSYDFGTFRLHAGFNSQKYNLANTKNQKESLIGAVLPVGAWTWVGQVARSKGLLSDADSVGLEAHYALSKRTTAYMGLNNTKFSGARNVSSDDYSNRVVGGGIRAVF